MCFWLANTRKKIYNWLCNWVYDLVLKFCSEISEWKCMHFFPSSLCWWIRLFVYLNWVFFIFRPGSVLKFSRIALSLKRMQLGSKTDLTNNRLILEFSWWSLLRFLVVISARTKTFKKCSIVFLFCRHQFFKELVWGVLWSVLSMCTYILATWFSNIDILALSKQTDFPSIVYFSSSCFLLELVMKFFFE